MRPIARWLCLVVLIIISAHTVRSQTIKKIVVDPADSTTGYYLVVEPEADTIRGALVLLAGFGQHPEATPPETKLHNVAFANDLLTVFYAGGNKLYADSVVRSRLSMVLRDVIKRYNVNPDAFVLGGFSAGGMIALRYVELCNQFPDRYPIKPRGVFTVDSPIDIFTIYTFLEDIARTRYNDLAVEEAERAIAHIKADHGIPSENVNIYADLTAFSMNTDYGENERHLVNTAVRTYHDVDISWRIIHRNQTVHLSNYEVTAELINRLVLMGNTKAEFMQSFRTGYRANGQRHPHSWSIVDEVECVQWIKGLVGGW